MNGSNSEMINAMPNTNGGMIPVSSEIHLLTLDMFTIVVFLFLIQCSLFQNSIIQEASHNANILQERCNSSTLRGNIRELNVGSNGS